MRPETERAALLLTLGCLWPVVAVAQGRALDFHVGRWYSNNQHARIYEFRTGGHLAGPFSHGVKALVTVSEPLGRRRAFYGVGYDLLIMRPQTGLGFYGLLGTALGLSTDTSVHKLGAQWSVGTGVEWRPFTFGGLALEARYRVEDRGPKGFWASQQTRSGWSLSLGLGMRLGARGATRANTTHEPTPVTAPTSVAGAAGGVVSTALDALGTPYRWGGTAENGFDCSGLVQWAYAQHGIRVPRRSRDQAQAGTAITPAIDALVPGDILLFAATPGGGVTHVGMFVGERKFIHSGSTGVQLSLLDYSDSNGAHWLARWVGARRVIS